MNSRKVALSKWAHAADPQITTSDTLFPKSMNDKCLLAEELKFSRVYSIPYTPIPYTNRCAVQVLTLANGDRILMTPQMKAMFEPENLNNASPATVSRAGIIYVSDVELGWGPVVESWLNKKREPEVAALRPCFDKLVGPMLDFVRCGPPPRSYNEPASIPDTVLVNSVAVRTCSGPSSDS